MPEQNLAHGSSLINGARFVTQSIRVAMLATVLSSALSPTTRAFQDNARSATTESVQTGAPAARPSTAADQRFGVCETPGVPTEQNVPAGVPAAAAPQVRAGMQQACNEYDNGFEATYPVTFYFALIAMVIGGFLPGWPLKWAGRARQRMLHLRRHTDGWAKKHYQTTTGTQSCGTLVCCCSAFSLPASAVFDGNSW